MYEWYIGRPTIYKCMHGILDIQQYTNMYVLDPSEKPMISEKPRRRPGIHARNSSSGDGKKHKADGLVKSCDSNKRSARPQKLIEPYEEVILNPADRGSKPSPQTLNTEASQLVDRPPVPAPKTTSPSDESCIYSEVMANDEKAASQQEEGEYCYADEKRLGKWSLQHIALGQPLPGVTATSPLEEIIYSGERFLALFGCNMLYLVVNPL